MRLQNEKTKSLTGLIAMASMLILGLTTTPAFANSNSSNGPFSPSYANPINCDVTMGQTCAEVYNSGQESGLYAISSSGSAMAETENNEDLPDGLSPGTSPSLTSSQTTIAGTAILTYGYDMTIPSGSTAYYQPSVSIYDQNGFLESCGGTQYTTSGGGIDSATVSATGVVPCF